VIGYIRQQILHHGAYAELGRSLTQQARREDTSRGLTLARSPQTVHPALPRAGSYRPADQYFRSCGCLE
jgi:hypothetical protein